MQEKLFKGKMCHQKHQHAINGKDQYPNRNQNCSVGLSTGADGILIKVLDLELCKKLLVLKNVHYF